MRLSCLEVVGFKSFEDETRLTFDAGVTAIVGPNGCGKSNIADAIRWVLGEQSAKSLRGRRMEDLIFNGSNGHKPLGMAQVSLTLINDGGETPSPVGYEEVTVTRRLFRSGENEYALNKTPCRLKDIRDFFLDVGIHLNGFSIIEQGKVEVLVNAKPQERRFLIEETAGILKYKLRCNLALKKLESAELDLTRCRDILTELRRQMNSLDRQARRAEHYRVCQQEMERLQASLLVLEYRGLQESLARMTAERDVLRDRYEVCVLRHQERQMEVERLRLEMGEGQKTVETQRRQLFDLERERERLENDRQLCTSQIQLLEEQAGKGQKEVEELASELATLHSRIQFQREQWQGMQARIEAQGHGLLRRRADLEVLRHEVASRQARLETEKKALLDQLASFYQMQNRVNSLEEKLEAVARRVKHLEAEEEEFGHRLANSCARVEDLEGELATLEARRIRLQEQRQGLVMQLHQEQQRLQVEENRYAALTGDLQAVTARWQLLTDLERLREGYREGVRKLLVDRPLAGLRGVVADFIQTTPQYEVAVEAVLGERLQWVIADDHPTIIRALEYLKANGQGEGVFIPLDCSLPPGRDGQQPHRPCDLTAEPGIHGKALDLVTCEQGCASLFAQLLDGVWVVRDLELALDLWRRFPYPCILVTLEGEVVHPTGMIAGGHPSCGGQGLLQRKRELGELAIRIGQVQEELAEMGERCSAAKAVVAELLNRQGALEEALQELANTYLQRQADLTVARQATATLEERLQLCRFEQQELVAEHRDFSEALMQEQASLRHLDAGRGEREGLIQTWQAELQAQRQQLDVALEEERQEQVAQTALQGERERLEQELARLDDYIRTLEVKQQAACTAMEEIRSRKAERLQFQEVLAQQIKEMGGREAQLTHDLQQREQVVAEAGERLRLGEEEVRTLKREIDEQALGLQELLQKVTEYGVRRQMLEERATREFQATMQGLLETVAGEGRPPEEIEHRLAALREELAGLGAVNFTALKEYEELQERHRVLQGQHDDLLRSIRLLHRTIQRINRLTREKLMAAYLSLNGHFQQVFSRLFQGGEASLKLEEGQDILEGGLEIVVQPPGKRLQHLGLLSLGEKTLTTIALLFAAFLVRPGPFCLMDEVDASLDEANVERFNRLLMDSAQSTQFILITHNRGTMTIARSLYGITMEEKGVSKILSMVLAD